MRIAVYENLPPGGAKRAAFELGRQLAGRHQLDLYRLSTTSRAAFDLAPLVREVYTYRYSPLFGRLDGRLTRGRLAPRSLTIFGQLERLQQRIAGDIDRRGYDAVLAHTDSMTQSPYLLNWLRLPSAYYCQEIFRIAYEPALQQEQRRRLAGKPPLIRTIALAEDRWVTHRLAAADRRNVAGAGEVLVNSHYMADRVRTAYQREARVCYLGVDAARFTPGTQGSRALEVLSIGSPLLTKGHQLVIEALALLPAAGRPRLRVVAPNDRDRDALDRLARARSVELAIETAVDEATLIEHYRRAIATICAARGEPFGLTAIESMACGTPVIAIREGGYLETVVHQATGLLVEPNPGALAEAIGSLVNDRSLLDRLGRASRQQVLDAWTWERSGERLEAILAALKKGSG